MPTVLDPFTQVYNRIIDILKADTVVSEIIRSGNFITFDKAIRPWKANVQPGDMPEVLIEPVTGLDQWASDSISAKCDIVWSIKVATNDPRLYWADVNDAALWTGVFPMKWALMVALDTAGDNLELNGDDGLTFCRTSRITASVKSPFDPAGNPVSEGRGTDGWTILCTLTTTLDLLRVNGVLQLPNG
jgi:hypothetical protein